MSSIPLKECPSHLLQDSCREERKNGEDGDYPHVAHPLHNRKLDAPQADGHQTDEGNPVLLEGKLFFSRPDGFNFKLRSVWCHTRAVTCQKEEPNEDDRDCRYRQGNCKPPKPVDGWVHFGKGNQVLWGGNGRTLATDIRREGNC